MPTVTVKMDDDLFGRIKEVAARRHTSKSAILREAFVRSLENHPPGSLLDQMTDLVGQTTGPEDLSTNARHYLEKGGYGESRTSDR